MVLELTDSPVEELDTAPNRPSFSALGVAGLASIGAGAIHAAAMGVHAEHPGLARSFAVLALTQIGLGLAALVRPRRSGAFVLAAVSLAAVVAWIVTRTTGITSISGLEVAESPQFADTTAAVLAGLAVLGGFGTANAARNPALRARLIAPGMVIALFSGTAMVSSATHVHVGDHNGNDSGLATAGGAIDESAPHDHADTTGTTAAQSATSATSVTSAAATPATTHQHDAAVVPVEPYDPTKPINLGGIDGVTPEQQAAAENLVAVNVVRLPQWADYRVAESAGFHSIGDGFLGHEHFINWAFLNDQYTLDPDHPESLVYEPQADGSKKLVSAMYMLPPSISLDQVPDIGGKLMQWHIHDNLCFTPGDSPAVAGLTQPDGTCNAPLLKLPSAAMIHVWIVPNRCGPFAALEGVGAGVVKPGEERLCDTLHGEGHS